MNLAFNLAMLAVDAAVLAVLARRPRPAVLLAGVAAAATLGGGAAVAVPAALGVGHFGVMALFAFLLLVHAPLLLAGGAWLLRRAAPRCAAAALAAAAVAGAVAVDAWWIEPTALAVTRYEIASPKLDRRLRIAVVADLQTDRIGAYERRALALTLAQRPDLILLPGDFLQVADDAEYERLKAELRAYLREIGFTAPLGAWAVNGDVERRDWPALFADTGVTAVVRKSPTFDLPGLTLTALSVDASRGVRTRIPNSEEFHVVFGHAPDFALGETPGDLLVAGHTHGGQVRLPFFGPPVTFTRVPRAWAAGLTDLGGGRHLVVSRGVGLERAEAPRIRFLCRPEIVVVDLVPA